MISEVKRQWRIERRLGIFNAPLCKVFCLLLIFYPQVLPAQKRSEIWTRLSVFSEDLIPKTKVTFEGQYRIQYQTRFTSSDLNTYTFRIWIQGKLGDGGFFYQSSPLAVFYRKSPSGAGDFKSTEIRLTQLAGYKMKALPLEFRTGLEWRNFYQEEILTEEFRSRTRLQTVMRAEKRIQPLLAAEFFYRFSSQIKQIDQLRLTGGMRGSLKEIEAELGYQLHIRNPRASRKHSQIIYINLTPKKYHVDTRK